METNCFLGNEDEHMDLPPGFRFHPTDEELITHYLSQKVFDNRFRSMAIGEVDLNKCEPWDLPRKPKIVEKERYFFCVRDRKYPTGLRTNRATDAGYWKATGKDKEIYRGKTLVGMKKTLVFYRGRAPKGEKTNWVMHEYRLEGQFSAYNRPKTAKNEWVICRVFQKGFGGKKSYIPGLVRQNSYGNESRPSLLPPLTDSSPHNSETRTNVTCFSNPTEFHNPQEDIVDSFNASYVASSSFSTISNSPVFFSKASVPISHHSNYISPPTADSHYPDSVFPPDQSILRMLLENRRPITKQDSKTEVSQDTGLSTDISSVITNHEPVQRNFEDQEDPSSCGGPVDLDCLWNY